MTALNFPQPPSPGAPKPNPSEKPVNPWHERAAVLIAILVTFVTVAAIFGTQNYRLASSGAIVVKTYAPEDGNFEPNTITVVAGRKAVIEVRNPQTFSHGFAIPALGVGIQEIKPGHVERLEFTPTVPGRYEFLCATWCTVNHMKMRGTLIVVPPLSNPASHEALSR